MLWIQVSGLLRVVLSLVTEIRVSLVMIVLLLCTCRWGSGVGPGCLGIMWLSVIGVILLTVLWKSVRLLGSTGAGCGPGTA